MQTLLSMHEMKKELAAVEAYLDNYMRFEHPSISNSALYTLHGGGKRLRPAFLLMTTMFFDNHEEYVIPLAASMEMIHMVSLIHDDIVDASDVRRGQATLNVRYGQRYALHTGDYILTKALQLINSAPHRERVLEILAKLSIEMCHGEIQQLLSVFDPYQTVEDYNYRIDRKTALLIAVCCQSGAVISSADEKMVQLFYDFGYNLGMAFQIKDDILDMEQNQSAIGKPAGSDLAHGILTLPTILVLKKDFPEKQHLIELIETRFPQGQSDVNYAIALIKKYHGLEEALAVSDEYVTKAKSIIHELPGHRMKKVLLAGADYINGRAF